MVKSPVGCAAGRGLGAAVLSIRAVEEMEGACHLVAETGGFAVPGSQVARELGHAQDASRNGVTPADAYRDSIW